jgi:6-phosphofructokinase
MGAKAVELLMNHKGNLVIGTKGDKIFSQNINEALSKKKTIDADKLELTRILSM